MKKLQLILVVLGMMLGSAAMAQEVKKECKDPRHEKCHRMLPPEERASKLAERFNLDAAQKEKLTKVFRKDDDERGKAEARKNKFMEREHAKMEKAMSRSEQEIGKIIGAENLKALQQEKSERMKARQGHHVKPEGKPCCHRPGCCQGRRPEPGQDKAE